MGSHGYALLLEAAQLAAVRHRDQRRKGPEQAPYVNHVISVAAILAVDGGIDDPQVLAAALLHDTVEDTQTTLQELHDRFGPEVAGLVEQLTDDKSLPAAERKQRQVAHAPHMSSAAKKLKIADKISNLRDLSAESPVGWSMDRKRAYLQWAQQVVEGCRGASAELERLFDATCADVQRRIGQ